MDIRENIKSPAIYTRKSKFTGKGDSIGNQVEECKRYLLFHYPELTESDITVFEDEGYSGGNTSRPQFQEMMKCVRERKFDAVVCYKLDRLTRSVADFTVLHNELNKYNAKFISTTEKFDTAIPAGRLMLTMIAGFAQMERETIAERIRDNMVGLAKTGRWLGGTPPTGYKSIETTKETFDGKQRTAHKLAIIPNEADLIKRIFKLFIEKRSLTKLETYFLQNHIKTKNNKRLTRFSIKAILENPVYMIADKKAYEYFYGLGSKLFLDVNDFDGIKGIMAYNKTKQNSDKNHVKRDYSEWIISLGDHPGIVSSDDWIKVATLLEENKAKSYGGKPRSHVALLPGKLFCAKCGDHMRPKMTQRKNATGEFIYDYKCATKVASKGVICDCKNINGNILDKTVVHEIDKLSKSPDIFVSQLEKSKQNILINNNEIELEIIEKNSAIAENKAKLKMLTKALSEADGMHAVKYIIDEINGLHEDNQNLELQVNKLTQMSMANDMSMEEYNLTLQNLLSFTESFNTMSIEIQREEISKLVKKITWDGVKINIYFTGSDIPTSAIPSENDNFINEITSPPKEPLRGDCERSTYVSEIGKKECFKRFHKRPCRNRPPRKYNYIY